MSFLSDPYWFPCLRLESLAVMDVDSEDNRERAGAACSLCARMCESGSDTDLLIAVCDLLDSCLAVQLRHQLIAVSPFLAVFVVLCLFVFFCCVFCLDEGLQSWLGGLRSSAPAVCVLLKMVNGCSLFVHWRLEH